MEDYLEASTYEPNQTVFKHSFDFLSIKRLCAMLSKLKGVLHLMMGVLSAMVALIFFNGAWLLRNLCYLFQSCSNNRVWILMHDILTIHEAKIEWIKAEIIKAPFSSRKFLIIFKIQNMKIFNVF